MDHKKKMPVLPLVLTFAVAALSGAKIIDNKMDEYRVGTLTCDGVEAPYMEDNLLTSRAHVIGALIRDGKTFNDARAQALERFPQNEARADVLGQGDDCLAAAYDVASHINKSQRGTTAVNLTQDGVPTGVFVVVNEDHSFDLYMPDGSKTNISNSVFADAFESGEGYDVKWDEKNNRLQFSNPYAVSGSTAIKG